MFFSKLKEMFGSAPAVQAGPISVPFGVRVYAIGDIHGRLDLLKDLFAQIEADDAARGPADTRIIFLGDLVDRGPDSAGVMEFVASHDFGDRSVDVLLGNHEEVFLKVLGGDLNALRFWLRIGGEEALLSYGTPAELLEQGMMLEIMEDFVARVPPHHFKLLNRMTDMVRVGDYCFVHAGVRPKVALERQRTQDLRWIRGEFLGFPGDFGAMVVHGHTITPEVEELPNRIGIDTGAYTSGKLTALVLEDAERRYLTAHGEAVAYA